MISRGRHRAQSCFSDKNSRRKPVMGILVAYDFGNIKRGKRYKKEGSDKTSLRKLEGTNLCFGESWRVTAKLPMMPLKWVLHWQPNAGTTVNTQILNEVSQCVESINGVKGGRWKATLTLYKPVLREQSLVGEFPRDFWGISLPEQPNKYYFIIRTQRIVMEADSSIQAIMEKLQSYKSRAALYFEGFQYQVGDFQLRVGKVVPNHSENMRGIIMEVEYLPLSSMEKARLVMEDFFDIWQEAVSKRSLPGHFMHIEPNFAEFGLSDHYSSQHTAVQYATVMAQLMATQSVQAVRN